MKVGDILIKVREDLTGQTFGEWLVLERAADYISPTGHREARWLCECSCEQHTQRVVLQGHLKHGKSVSCGCFNKSRTSETHKKQNKYDISGEFGILWTSNTNEESYFDLGDAEKILQHCWHKDSTGYLAATINGKTTRLHTFLGYYRPDHYNRNKLDNRRENLLMCTTSENNTNKGLVKTNTSGITGVYLYKRDKKWKAQIIINGKMKNLGTFAHKEDAIKARLESEAKYYGAFAPQRHLFDQYNINADIDYQIEEGAK